MGHVVKTDTIIAAVGRMPEMIFARVPAESGNGEGVQIPGDQVQWRAMMPYNSSGRIPRDMFRDTEPVSDYWAVVLAIAAGRRAASTIHHYLANGEAPVFNGVITSGPPLLEVNHLRDLAEVDHRVAMPELDEAERLDPDKETAQGFDEKAARAEADRCLNCGLICYQRTKYN